MNRSVKLSLFVCIVLGPIAFGCADENDPATPTPNVDATIASDSGEAPQDANTNPVPDAMMESDASIQVPEGVPTFWQNVAPILDASCMGCHKTGGIAPMQFDTYDETKTWGAAIVASTQARTMPPWLATADGSCGEFADSEWLSDQALATLESWVDSGMYEGEPAQRGMIQQRTLDATHSMMTPSFTPERQGGIFAQFDEYRCFRYPIEGSENPQFLTGYEVFPGNEAIVHHVIGVIVNPARESGVEGLTNAEQMQALADESPDREGWPCFTGAGDGVREADQPIAWAPGQGVVNLPEGTGVRIRAGSELVLQVHYNLANDADQGSSDQTLVNIKIEQEVDVPLESLYIDYFLSDFANFLPRGEADYEFKREASFRNLRQRDPLKIWGILPHMHERGRRLNATLKRVDSETEECAVEVNQWDFAWQRAYWYDTPIEVNPTDRWEITCNFDTADATSAILPGWGTRNEMCLTVLYVSEAE
jgi:hypothetical protein